jgi:hypothetical protein
MIDMSDRIFCDKCHTLYVPGERHGCLLREELGCSFCSNPAVSVDEAGKFVCASCIGEEARANDFKSKQDERKASAMKKGFDVNKPHHSETQTAFKTCANNCNSYANKSIHEDDGSLTFYCERCLPFAKRKVVAPSVSWYCVKCKRVVTTYVKDGLTKCYSCAGTTLILSDEIEKHFAKIDEEVAKKRFCMAANCNERVFEIQSGYCDFHFTQWSEAKKKIVPDAKVSIANQTVHVRAEQPLMPECQTCHLAHYSKNGDCHYCLPHKADSYYCTNCKLNVASYIGLDGFYRCKNCDRNSSVEVAPKTASPDAVNHPSHYNSHPSGVECITVTEHFNYNIGNAIKYLWRAGLKDSMIQDLKKAKFYVEREIERLTKAEAEGVSK